MHSCLPGSKNLTTLAKLLIGPDFPSLADELAEPCPDMNIKVIVFTVSKNFYYTY